MDDFSVPSQSNGSAIAPSPENFIVPGKRPLSSMSPLIFYNKRTGQAELVIGASGGSRIISAVAYVAMRVIWFNETIKQAIDLPRLHNRLIPEKTGYQHGFPQEYIDILQSKYGHIMKENNPRELSVVSGIHRHKNGELYANCDYRKPGGFPAGF